MSGSAEIQASRCRSSSAISFAAARASASRSTEKLIALARQLTSLDVPYQEARTRILAAGGSHRRRGEQLLRRL